MSCTYPRTVGFKSDGKTLSWSPKDFSKEYATFQLPCGKCIACRLKYASQWAVRCVDEARMHEKNAFITLTYSEKHYVPEFTWKERYRDFQLFIKRLRDKLGSQPEDRISYVVAGEYGTRGTKRAHFHVIIFNYYPSDAKYRYTNDNAHPIYSSKEIDTLWGKNDPDSRPSEVGSVTFESAGYVARYSAKKLAHGPDAEKYKPMFKVSSANAIGKSWLEKYYTDVFNYGRKFIDNGKEVPIPRYYEKWLKKHHGAEWLRFITTTKQEFLERSEARALAHKIEYEQILLDRSRNGKPSWNCLTNNQKKAAILKQKFEECLQKNQKL